MKSSLLRRRIILEILRPGIANALSVSEIATQVNTALTFRNKTTVSLRTISRDLRLLQADFTISSWCQQEDKKENLPTPGCEKIKTDRAHSQRIFYYFAEDGYRCYREMSVPEALGFMMMKDMVGHMMPSFLQDQIQLRLGEADSTLKRANQHNAVAWPNKFKAVSGVYELQPPKIGEEIGLTIQEALLKNCQIRVKYAPRNKPLYETTLHPLSLLQIGNVVYLIAYDPMLKKAPIRQYAIHRFQLVHLMEIAAITPDDFSLQQFLAPKTNGKPGQLSGPLITLRAIIFKGHRGIIEETPIGEKMQIEERGEDIIITTQVQHTWQLEHYILSVADQMEILDPPELREIIKQRICAAAARYAKI